MIKSLNLRWKIHVNLFLTKNLKKIPGIGIGILESNIVILLVMNPKQSLSKRSPRIKNDMDKLPCCFDLFRFRALFNAEMERFISSSERRKIRFVESEQSVEWKHQNVNAINADPMCPFLSINYSVSSQSRFTFEHVSLNAQYLLLPFKSVIY